MSLEAKNVIGGEEGMYPFVLVTLRMKIYSIHHATVPAASSERIPVQDPSTGEVIGSAPASCAIDAQRALEAASSAGLVWSTMPMDAREKAIRVRAWGAMNVTVLVLFHS